MKKKELLKQSKKLAAVITAVALMDTPVAYAAEGGFRRKVSGSRSGN